MTDKQKEVFLRFWAELRGDVNKELNFILSSRANQRQQVRDWWTAKKTKLEADKATLTQEFLNERIAEIDSQITDGEDLKDNF